MTQTQTFLSRSEVAEHLGIGSATVSSYLRKGLLPEPDAKIGRVNGWLPETIDKWNAERPGRGHRTDLEWWKDE
ncbi:MAG: transcriptional regulator [Actinomycetaceae bacterium]|nr:transcriptional regulator [Actinomycetaceae bacterium]